MSDEKMRAEFEAGHTKPARVQWCGTRGVYAATEATLPAEDEARNYTSMFYAYCAGRQQAARAQQGIAEPVAWIVRRYEDCVGICPDKDEAERLSSAMNAEVYPLYTHPSACDSKTAPDDTQRDLSSAGDAQPPSAGVPEFVNEEWVERLADVCDISESHARETISTVLAAAPQPPQPDWTPVSNDVLRFLWGEAPLNGEWYHEVAEKKKGAFWWRKYLPRPEPPENELC